MKSKISVSIAILVAFVLGLATYHPVASAVESFTITHCAHPTIACNGGVNSSTGLGSVGGSLGGNGSYGWTSAVAASAKAPFAGVLGSDLSPSGTYDAGVFGRSDLGTGVLGTSKRGNGIVGQTYAAGTGSATGSGVLGQDFSSAGPEQNAGVSGTTTNGYGVSGAASGAYGTGVFGLDSNGGAGNGVKAEADSSQGGAALGVFAPNGAALIAGGGSGSSFFLVDGHANVQMSGQIYTAGKCNSGCARRRIQSYGMSAALPTIEDNGEARITGGAVEVRLDPAFANAIDARSGYIVQLTAEGDTRGLYVASRSAASFVVREVMGGRGTLPFAYRIVAHPYGVRAQRLPFVEPQAGESAARGNYRR